MGTHGSLDRQRDDHLGRILQSEYWWQILRAVRRDPDADANRNCDCYPDAHAHSNCHSNCNCNCNGNCHANCDRNTNSDGDSYSDTNCNGNLSPESYSDTKTSPNLGGAANSAASRDSSAASAVATPYCGPAADSAAALDPGAVSNFPASYSGAAPVSRSVEGNHQPPLSKRFFWSHEVFALYVVTLRREGIDWAGLRAAAVAIGIRQAARQAVRDLPSDEQERFVQRAMKRCSREVAGQISTGQSRRARTVSGARCPQMSAKVPMSSVKYWRKTVVKLA